jgi:hypothetical protein
MDRRFAMEEEIRPISGIVRETLTFTIPVDLVKQFQKDVRVIIKFPGLIGVPIPDIFLNKDILNREALREFEPMLVPRQTF